MMLGETNRFNVCVENKVCVRSQQYLRTSDPAGVSSCWKTSSVPDKEYTVLVHTTHLRKISAQHDGACYTVPVEHDPAEISDETAHETRSDQ